MTVATEPRSLALEPRLSKDRDGARGGPATQLLSWSMRQSGLVDSNIVLIQSIKSDGPGHCSSSPSPSQVRSRLRLGERRPEGT